MLIQEWKNRSPVVIVPTNYYTVPTETFRKMGVNLVIWANHNMRSAVSAMQNTSRIIFEQQNLLNVENQVAKVKEIFRIQGEDELKQADKKYL